MHKPNHERNSIPLSMTEVLKFINTDVLTFCDVEVKRESQCAIQFYIPENEFHVDIDFIRFKDSFYKKLLSELRKEFKFSEEFTVQKNNQGTVVSFWKGDTEPLIGIE